MKDQIVAPRFSLIPGFGSRAWLQLLVLCAVFVCGALSGALLAVNKVHQHIRGMMQNPDEAADHIIKTLTAKLSLDEGQSAAVAEIVRKHHTAISAVRLEAAPRVHQEFDSLEDETLKILNADQQEKFRRITQEVRSVFLPPLQTASK